MEELQVITIPKFVINRFNLKKHCDDELPEYVRLTQICLKDDNGNVLDVQNSKELVCVLSYFQTAAKVCLDYVQKRLNTGKNDNEEYDHGDKIDSIPFVEQKNIDETNPFGVNYEKSGVDSKTTVTSKKESSILRLPLKKAKRRRFFDHITGVKVKDLIDVQAIENETIEPGQKSLIISKESSNNVNLTLRFGVSSTMFRRKPSRFLIEVEQVEEDPMASMIRNEFYRHLLLKTTKPTKWRKFIEFFGRPNYDNEPTSQQNFCII